MNRANNIGHIKKTSAKSNAVSNDAKPTPAAFQEHRQRVSWLEDQVLLVRCAAKINLTLSVGRVRPDGFHEFESLMATITLYDDLLIRPGLDSINLTCDDSSLPVNNDNLVYRACSLFAAQSDTDANVDLELIKRIPSQAGLGGGSADAAGTLVGLNELWDLDWPRGELAKLGAMLGSDVGFFMHGPLAICSGRGEVVRPLDFGWEFWGVVMKPPISLSTAEVYRHFDETGRGQFARAAAFARRLPGSKPSEVYEYLVNDLETAAFRISRELGVLKQDLENLLNVPVLLSGSGSSLFALFDTRAAAESAVKRVQTSHKALTCWLVKNNTW